MKAAREKERAEGGEGFFTDCFSLDRPLEVEVNGLYACPVQNERSITGEELSKISGIAVRAAYCLGFEKARVLLSSGPHGPFVVSVTEIEEACGGDCASLEAKNVELENVFCEYVVQDPVTGLVQPARNYFQRADVFDKGKSQILKPHLSSEKLILWTPMPLEGAPLNTVLCFSGGLSQQFLRLLDSVLAVPGMMSSPVPLVRRRNVSGEGLLGNYSSWCGPLGDCGFQYKTLPTLLGKPSVLKGVITLARVLARDPGRFSALDWKGPLDQVFAWQKAFYYWDKAYFQQHLSKLWEVLESLNLPSCEEKNVIQLAEAISRGDLEDDDKRASPGMSGLPSSIVLDESSIESLCRALEVLSPSQKPGLRLTAGSVAVAQGLENVVDEFGIGFLDHLASIPVQNIEKRPGVADENTSSGFKRFRMMGRPNPRLSSMLSLPLEFKYGIETRISPAGGIQMDVGPILGILAKARGFPGDFGIEKDRFRRIIEMGQDMGILVYVFSSDDIESSRAGIIRGWVYRDGQGWFRENLPLPHIIYDRYMEENEPPVDEVLQEKFPPGYSPRFINSPLFTRLCKDKFGCFQALREDPVVAAHLPETRLVSDLEEVRDFIRSEKAVFLKLRRGRGSRGLVFIRKEDSAQAGKGNDAWRDHDYIVETYDRGNLRMCGEDALTGFLENLFRRNVCEGPSEYVMQKAVKWAGSVPFEVRVIYEKGGAGRWLRTGMVCRLGGTGASFIIPKKEVHARYWEVMDDLFPDRKREITEEIRDLSRRIHRVLEKSSGLGGEVSIDFTIDENGTPWLIEVNSKPATLFRDTGAFKLRDLSILRILNYSVYLFRNMLE